RSLEGGSRIFWSRMLLYRALRGGNAGDAEWLQQLARSQFHEPDFGGHLKQQEALFHIASNLFGSSRGPAQKLPVTSRRPGNARDRALQGRLVLSPAQPQREGEIAGPDEESVHPGGGGNRVDLVERRCLFHHADGEYLLVGRII